MENIYCKKLIFFLTLLFIVVIANAQDQIKLKAGEIIRCKILDAQNDVVKYRKWEFIDGPRYVIKRREIATITYDKSAKTPSPATSPVVYPPIAVNKATPPSNNASPNKSNSIASHPKPIVQPTATAVSTATKPIEPTPAPIPKKIVEPTPIVQSSLTDERTDYITGRLKDFKNHMLVIANQDYSDNAINDLDHPIEDAKRVIKIITDNYTFEKQNVYFLQNPDRGEIIRSFDKLAQQVSSSDNLIIFYAGHGLWDSQLKKGYWLPRNAHQQDRSDWFSNSDLRDYIGGINSKHTLLIADACFSGSIFKTRDAFTHSPDANGALELYKMSSRQAMTSGAMKSVPDKSVFIDYLCKRLQDNKETFLGAEQLFSSFKIAVINNSPNGQIPQFGVIKESGDEGGDFVFIRR